MATSLEFDIAKRWLQQQFQGTEKEQEANLYLKMMDNAYKTKEKEYQEQVVERDNWIKKYEKAESDYWNLKLKDKKEKK